MIKTTGVMVIVQRRRPALAQAAVHEAFGVGLHSGYPAIYDVRQDVATHTAYRAGAFFNYRPIAFTHTYFFGGGFDSISSNITPPTRSVSR
jgi:hypothetical protein